MARLTDAERIRICALYKRRRKEIGLHRIDEARWRTFEYIGRQVKRGPHVIRDTLIAKRVIDPTPPTNVGEPEMNAIATDYLSGISIRGCANQYGMSYGTIRRVLIYKRVKLRSRGRRRGARS